MWLWPLVALKSNINTFSPPACHITTFKWVYLNTGDISLLCVLKTTWVSAALVLRGSPSAVQGCSIVFAEVLSASKHSVKQHLWQRFDVHCMTLRVYFFPVDSSTDRFKKKQIAIFFSSNDSYSHTQRSLRTAGFRVWVEKKQKQKMCVLGCYKAFIVPCFHKLTSESLRGAAQYKQRAL